LRRLVLAAVAAAALVPVATAHACYAKPLLHQDGDTLYISVQTGRCSAETVAVPLPVHA
jgi:hypothetical protein